MKQTVAQLIEALKEIEDQNQPVISVIVIAQDLITDDDEEMTPEEFQGLIEDNEGLVVRAIDDAYEGIRDAIY